MNGYRTRGWRAVVLVVCTALLSPGLAGAAIALQAMVRATLEGRADMGGAVVVLSLAGAALGYRLGFGASVLALVILLTLLVVRKSIGFPAFFVSSVLSALVYLMVAHAGADLGFWLPLFAGAGAFAAIVFWLLGIVTRLVRRETA